MAERAPNGYFPGWDAAFARGRAAEDAFCELAELDGAVEIKREDKCRKTEKVCIEVAQHGRPSGLTTTQAKYWAIRFFDDWWILAPVPDIKRVVRNYYNWREGRTGKKLDKFGDNCNQGVLMPIREFVRPWAWLRRPW